MSWASLEYKMEEGKGPLRDDRSSRRVRLAPARRQENVVPTLKEMDLNPNACP